MTIKELVDSTPNVQLVISAAQLREYSLFLIDEVQKTKSTSLVTSEEYLTAFEACELLKVSKSTLWRWNKKGYLCPVRVGCDPRYRKSDIIKIVEG